jgi:hypothetical protein
MLDTSPRVNWVEKHGGLPRYIERIAVHLIAKGMTRSRAIATAINAAKRMCATGDLNFPGAQQVNPGSRAEACKAVAQWTALKARAKADTSLPAADRRVIELAFQQVDQEAEMIDLASPRPGLVQIAVKVRSRAGKVFTRRMWVRPGQKKAMEKQGGAPLSAQGLKTTREQTKVLEELAKIPREKRPKGWEGLVKALADPRHGGRLGPEKRKLLRAVEESAPADSPLRKAATAALKADVPTERKRDRVKRAARKVASTFKPAEAKEPKQRESLTTDEAVKRWNALPDKERMRRAKRKPKLGKGYRMMEDGSIIKVRGGRKVELAAKHIPAESREKAAAKGQTAYDHSFPIRNKDELRRAIAAYGRAPADKRALLRRFILARAKALGAMDLVPEAWKEKAAA